jgi:uncharacterized protein (TIGR02246 family)
MMLALVLFLVPGAAFAQQDAHAKAALKEMTPTFQTAFNAGDAAGVAALYAQDGALHPPNSAPVQGRDNIEAFWATALEAGNTAELTTDHVWGMGDAAAETGMYVITGADGSHLDHGHYSLVYTMENGKWKIASDMWNSDMAPSM